MTVSRSPIRCWSPCANLPPPTPPARATTPLRSRIAEGRLDLADPLDRLAVVRGGEPGDQRREAGLDERRELRGDAPRRAEEERRAVEVRGAVRLEQLRD